MLPPAPERFSTMMGWPSEARTFSASRRAVESSGPPGGYGTTKRSGLVGKSVSCAAAGARQDRVAARATAPPTRARRTDETGKACGLRICSGLQDVLL